MFTCSVHSMGLKMSLTCSCHLFPYAESSISMVSLYPVTHSTTEELENYARLVISGKQFGHFQPTFLLLSSLWSLSVYREQSFSTFQTTLTYPTYLHTHSRRLHWSSSSCDSLVNLHDCSSWYKVAFTHRISPFSNTSASSVVL